ncbi:MAG: PPOX class F420-dependent oxidoreductase [Dehalococcoidia bacterium]
MDDRTIALATYRRDGRAVATVLDGTRILVWTDAASGKAKRIRANGRAAVAPCDARGRTKAAALAAAGRVLPAAEDARARQLLSAKYRLLKPLVDLWNSAGASVRRKPRAVEIYLEITLAIARAADAAAREGG